eukprot:m51a1_g6732 hypothetical protein (340) ;mRNA; f:195181-196307
MDPTSPKDAEETGPAEAPRDDDDEAEDEVQNGRIERAQGEEDEEDELPRYEGDVKLEPFNLRQEREEGFFDESGNYVEYKLPQHLRDAWLDEYDEKHAEDMEKEAGALEARWRRSAKEQQERDVDDLREDVMLNTVASKRALIAAALDLIDAGETSARALRRLADKKSGDKERFQKLTKTLDSLLSCGYVEIYSQKRDGLQRMLEELDGSVTGKLLEDAMSSIGKKRTTPEGAAVADNDEGGEPSLKRRKGALGPGNVLWEYTTEASPDPQGPFTTEQMVEWRKQGFFVGQYRAKVRRVPTDSLFEDAPEEPWADSETVDFAAAAAAVAAATAAGAQKK